MPAHVLGLGVRICFLALGFSLIVTASYVALDTTMMDSVLAASGYTPPRSGLEPPDSPKRVEALPGGRSISRTPEGGMGYTDAYGNTISDRTPEAKPQRPRLRPGAYGSRETAPRRERPLPDPQGQAPVWSFQ